MKHYTTNASLSQFVINDFSPIRKEISQLTVGLISRRQNDIINSVSKIDTRGVKKLEKKYEVLRQYFGYTAFRGGQEALIDAQLAGRDVIGIMPTGGGKSLCYQIPALLQDGVTLVISPLISLMQDQVTALRKVGIPAAYINSSLSPEHLHEVYRRLHTGNYRIVYVAPERLMVDGFLNALRGVEISLVAVDEAHCISQWGQDFRPSYLRIVDFLQTLERRPIVSAFTATATEQVREDIIRILELRDPLRVVTGFDRPNLRFEVLKPKHKANSLQSLIAERRDKSGIIYCATRKEVEKTCEMLQSQGIAATRYHAGLEDEERHRNQEDFVYDRCPVMVATNAFGMGIDKSNVSYVIHYNMPQSLEAYYQEAGRAGRDGTPADCILLYAAGDVQTAKYLIQHSSEESALSAAEQAARIELDLKRLDRKVGYCKTTQCLRGYILDYFGQEHPAHCENCGNCSGEFIEKDITTEAQMILSCIWRIRDKLGYSLGSTAVILTLRGSTDQRILALGLNELSTYGLMRSINRNEIRDMMEILEQQGYLHTDPDHGGVSLTTNARAVLFQKASVSMQVRVQEQTAMLKSSTAKQKTRTAASALESAADQTLFVLLKDVRMRIARKENIPVYIVFSNATLQDMAVKRPHTMAEFLEVSGVGRVKAAHYGEQFLAAIREWEHS